MVPAGLDDAVLAGDPDIDADVLEIGAQLAVIGRDQGDSQAVIPDEPPEQFQQPQLCAADIEAVSGDQQVCRVGDRPDPRKQLCGNAAGAVCCVGSGSVVGRRAEHGAAAQRR